MFFRKKEKLYLGSFLRVFLGMLLKSEVQNLDDYESDLLTKEYKEYIKQELPFFRFTLLLYQLNEIKTFGAKKFSFKELAQTVSMAAYYAYQDNGITKEQADDKIDFVDGRFMYYSDELKKIDQSELESRGVFFYLIVAFVNLIQCGKKDLKNEQFRLQSLAIFNIGKQIYQSQDEALKEMLKNTKFLD